MDRLLALARLRRYYLHELAEELPPDPCFDSAVLEALDELEQRFRRRPERPRDLQLKLPFHGKQP